MSAPGPADRLRQTGRLLRSEGAAGIAARLVRRAAARVAPPGQGTLPVTRDDLRRAGEIAAAGWVLPEPLPAVAGEPLTVAWVVEPGGAGSGGHTTLYRMVAALERAGHRCILYLQDRHGWDIEQHRAITREWWPWMQAEIRDAAAGIEDAHAIFATSWETAYPVLASPARGRRFYLVQDFEPAFHPAGSAAMMAESTYRFGFHGITAGRWLAERLRTDYGMPADHFDFGRDLDYALDTSPGADAARNGICLYCRPETPRRAFELAVLTLDLFAQRHPEVEIHLFGRSVKDLPFAATDHGLLRPDALDALYNRSIAGLVLSATNVSLVPHEMLASGCIPVVNDADHNRMVLANDHVAYAPGTPFELADALSRLVERPLGARAAAAAAASASVAGDSWDAAGETVERIVREVVLDTRAAPVLLRAAG